MKFINWKRKLASRKFWAAVAGVVVSLLIAFGADAATVEKVTGIVTASGTLVIYILAESATDVAAIKTENKDSTENVD